MRLSTITRQLIEALLLTVFLLSATLSFAADSATLNGTVIDIPVVAVGDQSYSVQLTLIPGTEPPSFALSAANELDNADNSNAAIFSGTTLLIPGIQVGASNLSVVLALISDSPIQFQLASFTTVEVDASAFDLFSESVATQIVDTRCSLCHVSGGVAGDSSLHFTRTGENRITQNFDVLEAFVATRDDAQDYILTKVSGGLSHGGGTQLAVGSTDYNSLQSVLALLTTGSTEDTGGDVNFYSGVDMLSSEATLRRAAILLAGRAPTTEEYAAVSGGDDDALRSTLRALMTGDNFHEFLLESANDRLLVRGVQDGTFLDGGGIFPNFTNHRIELDQADRARGLTWSFDQARFVNGVDRGLRDSPLELIAYIVENDRPYSEILTADYMMTNSIAAWAMNGSGTFSNPEDYSEFQPVTLDNYYTWSEDVVYTPIENSQDDRIDNPGSLSWKYPHAGVLNTQAYLFRYPTTATNRNRARARWTYYHFLDFDIEKSAPRTTDPVALADTNNPTLFNSNCTVCHANMDPVAGAFQLYADEGQYRIDGYDSLDGFYKYPDDWESRLYQDGDTWYRDMRTPGFGGQDASGDSSLQWLAQQIVQDPSFATAAVKFWWPAVIGTELVTQPEVQSDSSYAAELLAYNAQTSSIESIANSFSANGMLLKDLLVDLMMSPWFRADSVDSSAISAVELAAHDAADFGSERLLTPEQLTRKTTALTGYTLGSGIRFDMDLPSSSLPEDYGLYYGGIDSAGVTRRATEMTALMSMVAMTHAVESACPIVLREFALDDGTRNLFNGINDFVTPLTLGIQEFEVDTHYDGTEEAVFTDVQLPLSTNDVLVSINNGYCDWNQEDQVCDSNSYLQVVRVDITSPGGVTQQLYADEQSTQLPTDCAWFSGDGGFGLCNGGVAKIQFTPTSAGQHRVTATLRAVREGGDHPYVRSLSVSVGAESREAPLTSTAAGAEAIKSKLIELHQQLHGETYSTSDVEIDDVYQLFVESWDEVRSLTDSASYSNISWAPDLTCKYWSDYNIGEGMPTDVTPSEINYGDPDQGDYPWIGITEEMSEFITRTGRDPMFAKQAWVTVMVYMLSHYNYLYE